jgi:hypothetical protein
MFSFLALPALADEVGGEDIRVPTRPTPAPAAARPVTPAAPAPVTAPPPPFVSLESTSIAAGVGFSWGGGTLTFEGRPHSFSAKGLTLGGLGASTASGIGDVSNLERLDDFEGTYVAVGAGAAAGAGASAVTMRNEHGVVITLRSDLQGAQLNLGAEGVSIALD